jgi:5-methylcytosine-specific restriction endonuclease McrA
MKYKGYEKKKKCEYCGSPDKLVIHHLDGSRRLGKLGINNDPKNLVTLCKECHIYEHSKTCIANKKLDKKIREWLVYLAKKNNVSSIVMRRKILLKVKNSGIYKI